MTTLLTKFRIFRAALAAVDAEEIIEAERARRLAAARAKATPAQVHAALVKLRDTCDAIGAGWVARESGIDGELDDAMAVLEAAFSHPGDRAEAA